MKKFILSTAMCLALTGCDAPQSADQIQREQTNQATTQAAIEIGMPQIVNFQEKRMAKMIYEMRDTSIATHSYVFNEVRGCLVYLGNSIGFGLPYATQYSNPERKVSGYEVTLPQPEPNGLFMPPSAEATWILLKDPNSEDVKPVYVEARLVVSPFKLPSQECK